MKKVRLNTIAFYGKEMEASKYKSSSSNEAEEPLFEVKKVFDLSSTRSKGQEKVSYDLEEDDTIELTFEDDTIWIGAIEDIQQLVQPKMEMSRSTSSELVLDIPSVIPIEDGTRGISNLILKALGILGKKTGVPEKAVKTLGEKYENKSLENQEGLYYVTPDFELERYNRKKASSDRTLLFIHGTASSTKGSFEKLADSSNNEVWNILQSRYENRVLGFQHRTLTHSPFQNLHNLLKELPDQISLDLVTHSRGGLVGELLIRFLEDKNRVSSQMIEELGIPEKDRKLIPEIRELIENKNISVNRFVRVACPGGGTSLMGKPVEYMFNALLNLISTFLKASIVASAFSILKEIIVYVAKQKNNPEVFPGLYAMAPQSPFIGLINSNYTNDRSDLSQLVIIAGSKSNSISFSTLLIILSRLVFKGKNDLVVNTASMYYASRDNNKPYFYTHFSKEVLHFSYFKNFETQQALRKSLTENLQELPEFKIQDEQWVNEEIRGIPGGRVKPKPISGTKNVIVLLPGIMGSTLLKKDKRVWISFPEIIGRQLRRLELKNGDEVTTDGLIATSYKKLINHLKKKNYDVIAFPFDWRKGIPEAGELLTKKIEEIYNLLQETNRKKNKDYQVSILAHSMGGLVAREIAFQNKTLWTNLNKQSRFKTVLLGTPWLGSYRISYVLASQDKLIKKLKLLDRDFKKDSRLLNIFSKYPGLLQLLPIGKNSQNDFSDTEEWKEFIDLLKFKFEVPNKSLLKVYEDFKNRVEENLDKIDYRNIVYVAGRYKETPRAYYNLNDKLFFDSTARGDESVTWESGIPDGINESENLYFVEATHGDLSCKPSLFPGITEILAKGSTFDSHFRRSESGRGINVIDSKSSFDFEEDSFIMGEAGLYADVLGISLNEEMEVGLPPLKISVLNADLKMSSAPLIIGHFSRDGILRAEAAADTYLSNAITNKYLLGVYPEAANTHEIFLNANRSPFSFKGAIIVGLGELEEFSSQTLVRTIEKAMITYMLEAPQNTGSPLKVSSLLVGSNYGELSIETSIQSILLGVQNANAKVYTLNPDSLLIEQVEFVEIYKDKAIASFLFIDELIQQNYEKLLLTWSERKINTRFGNRTRLVMENQRDWWQRVSIESDYNSSNGQLTLNFNSATARAREEKQSVSLNLEMFRGMIEGIAVKREWRSDDAQLIYEMLIPNRFKENISNRNNILFILDEHSAALPWELLQPGEGKGKPLCVNGGLVRQLATRFYNPIALLSKSNSALIIGDPDLEGAHFASQLPSANKEAETVNGILQQKISDIELLRYARPPKIIRELTKSNCKILHIAAHGVFNPLDKTESGIIIGKQVFQNEERAAILNEDFIEQLRNIPELVFINTCYSGTLEMPGADSNRDKVALAANIGIKWITKGAKAVVITGWEVNDYDGLLFAKVFYDCMVNGSDFATAIKNARSQVYASNPNSNTWGAYQCYGDPFYKLNFSNTVQQYSTSPFILKEEAVYTLENLNSKIEIDYYSKSEILAELESIKTRLEKSPFNEEEKLKSGVYEILGNIYANLNKNEEALEVFKKVMDSQITGLGIGSTERYYAIKNKLLVNEFLNLNPKRKKDSQRIEEIGKELAELVKDLEGITRTSKVHGVFIQLGNLLKSQALLEKDLNKKNRLITKSINTYAKVNQPEKSLRVFQSTYHRLILNGILYYTKKDESLKKKLQKEIEDFESKFSSYFNTGILVFNEEDDYWHRLRNINRILVKSFCNWEDLDLTERLEYKGQLIEGYQSIFKNNYTEFRKDVEWKYFDICIRFINDSEYSGKKQLVDFLTEIRSHIQ